MPLSLFAPPHTPFDDQGDVNLSQIEPLAAHLARSRVSGVFLCGSTGEGMSLSVRERKEIVEAWVDVAARHKLDVIVQVGTNSQRDAMSLAAHAARLGVSAISAHAPTYFRPQTVNDLIGFFEPIAAAAGDTRFYYYDIPELTGVDLPTTEFLRIGANKIRNLAGIKYSNGDLVQFQSCLRLDGGRFDLLWGCDEALLAGYALGARGAVGSTYNFVAPLAHQMVASFDAGDLNTARALQAKLVDVVNVLSQYGYLASAKAIMAFHGVDCGSVRAPLRPITPDQKVEIVNRVTSIGFPFDAVTHYGQIDGKPSQPHFVGTRRRSPASSPEN